MILHNVLYFGHKTLMLPAMYHHGATERIFYTVDFFHVIYKTC